MAKKTKKQARENREKLKNFEDFRAILDLPERLAIYLREWFHLDKVTWDFALSKIGKHKEKYAAWLLEDEKTRKRFHSPVYKEWSKSKGKGKGRRYFAAPCDELKVIQKCILNRFLLGTFVHSARHGNQKGASILTNAEAHIGFAKAIYSVDIMNAFPTVFRSRIKANLRKPFEYGLRQFSGVTFGKEDVEKMLESVVDLIAWHDRLPQGPPTSPRILDIVCLKMDMNIYEFLNQNSTPFQAYKYTAYVDDLTISSNDEIPDEIKSGILEIIEKNGFIPHTREDKVEYFSPQTGKVPVVTGLVINREGPITMSPRKVNQIRGRLNNFGRRKIWDVQLRGEAAGLIGYVRQVYPDKLPSKLRQVVPKVEERLKTERKKLLA